MQRVLAVSVAALALAACTASSSGTNPAPTAAAVASSQPAAAAGGEKVAIDLSSTYTDETTAYYAGQALDSKFEAIKAASTTPAQWQAMHESLKAKAKSTVEFNKNNKLPSAKMAIYLFETKAPDLKATKADLPDTGMIAVYDNILTGEWRFCFGGQRTDAGRVGDMVKCVYDADPASAGTYDPAKP